MATDREKVIEAQQAIMKRFEEYQKLGRKRIHFNVAPRYTPGSPAQVPIRTAVMVALEERQAIKHNLDGIYGEERRKKAEELGLKGIVEARREGPKKRGWDVLDLITGERFDRPYTP
jgi:hypothetical protein